MEMIGWSGSILILTSYGLSSYQRIRTDSLFFYLMNIFGGAFLIVYSIYKSAPPNIFINVVWVLIALPAFFKIIFGQKK
jgi:hypothetical protein